jgi:hypothetical protein
MNNGHNNWDRVGSVLNSTDGLRTRSNDEVDPEFDQFGCEAGESLGLPLSPSMFNDDVLPFHVAAFAQSFQECREPSGHQGRGSSPEKADSVNIAGLLRLGGERGGEHGSQPRYERAAVDHSMTGSARSSSDGGTVRPSALAVLRLIPIFR